MQNNKVNNKTPPHHRQKI